MSLGVIEHFRGENRQRILRAHFDVIRDGGICIVGVPHASCPPYRLWKLCLESIRWWPYGLEIPYTKRELRNRALQAGFHNPSVHCIGFWQSIGDFWLKDVLRKNVDWVDRKSWLDRWWGANLLVIAKRPAA